MACLKSSPWKLPSVKIESSAGSSVGSNSHTRTTEAPPPAKRPRLQWAERFSELYGDEATADCAIKVHDEILKAHQSLLMAQSKVLRSKLLDSNVIKVDAAVGDVRNLLFYLYYGYLNEEMMGEEWLEYGGLFKLADEFELHDLRALLEEYFAASLTAQNVCDTLLTTTCVKREPKLLEACLQLIVEKKEEVFADADWEELKMEQPELIADLFEMLVQKQ